MILSDSICYSQYKLCYLRYETVKEIGHVPVFKDYLKSIVNLSLDVINFAFHRRLNFISVRAQNTLPDPFRFSEPQSWRGVPGTALCVFPRNRVDAGGLRVES